MLSLISMIILNYGAGAHAGKGGSISGWVFFGLFFGVLILAYIAYQNHLKKEDQKKKERERRKNGIIKD